MVVLKKNLNILVIEDNPGDYVLIEEYLAEGLESSNIRHVQTFNKAKTALAETQDFDVILLDLSLPDQSGENLVKKMMELAGQTPVIVLTGFENQEFGLKTLSMGVSDYLLKDECNPFVLSKIINYSIERYRINASLKQSERQYRSTFNLSPQPIYLVDMDTHKFVDVNEAAVKQYGYSKEEFLTMDLTDIRPKEEIPVLKKKIVEADSSNSIFYEGLFLHKKKNGEVIDVKIRTSRLEEKGRKLRMVLAEDITEKKYYSELEKLERDVLELNALHKIEFEDVVTCFVNGIEDIHPKMKCSILKLQENRLYSFVSPGLNRGFLDAIDGMEIGNNTGSCGTAAYTKQQVISENVFEDELWEDYRDLAKKYNFSACWSQPIIDNKGDVIATFAVYYEKPTSPSKLEVNTVERAAHILRILFESREKEKAEEKLAMSEKRFRALVQDGSDLIAILDKEANYKYVAPTSEAILGIKAEEFIGTNALDYIHEDDRERIISILDKLQDEERINITPFRFKDTGGNWHWIETTITNLLDNPAVNGFVANSRDVTEQRNREEKLRELSLVASRTTDIVIITDSKGYITWTNEAFEKLTGYTLEEASGRKPGELLQGPETNENVKQKLSRAIRNYKPAEATILNYSKKGNKYWLDIMIDPIFDEEGKCTHFIGVQRDVTEKIEKENELRESLERYDIVSKATSDTIWDLDLVNNRMRYNSNIYHMFGYKERDVKSVGSWWKKNIHPEDLKTVEETLTEVLKKDKERFRIEYRFQAADGSYKYISDRAFVIKDETGIAIRMIGAMQDVTKEVEEEERLKLLESVITNTQESVVITEAKPGDLPGRKILYVNKAFSKLTGYSEEEVIGKTLNFLSGRKTDPGELKKLREAMGNYEMIEIEFINYKKSGEEFWINTSMVPVSDNEGNYTHWVAIGRDVTPRRTYEQEIESSLAEKETLLAEIHHRVKNNLAVISGMMQLQAFDSEDKELQEKLFDSVSRIKTMATVHELLYHTNSFSNIEFSKTLRYLIKNISETLGVRSGVHIDINSEIIKLNINQAIPASLIVNEVITNAYKHAFKDNGTGNISIDLKKTDNRVQLSIADSGIGLPQDFNHEDVSSMGLKLINVLSEQIGAEYNYNSTGNGTEFTIHFEITDVKGIGNANLE